MSSAHYADVVRSRREQSRPTPHVGDERLARVRIHPLAAMDESSSKRFAMKAPVLLDFLAGQSVVPDGMVKARPMLLALYSSIASVYLL